MNFSRGRGKEDPEINLIPLIDVLLIVLIFLAVEIAFRMPSCILEVCRRIDMALFEGRLRRAQARQQEVDGEEGVQATGFRWTQPNEEQN